MEKEHFNFKGKTGEIFITKQGWEIEIIEYFGWNNCTILVDGRIIRKNISYQNIKFDRINNPYYPSFSGVGFIGEGKYTGGKNDFSYKYLTIWSGMLQRCYNEKRIEKNPSYKGVTVCKEWHNFQTFAKWYEENWKEGFELDKDILFKGNKVYSPNTCTFVPQEINSLFTKKGIKRGDCPIGVIKMGSKFRAQIQNKNNTKIYKYCDTPEEAFQAYKTAKEIYIKEVADKYKNQITEQTYQAMYNYQVEIID